MADQGTDMYNPKEIDRRSFEPVGLARKPAQASGYGRLSQLSEL